MKYSEIIIPSNKKFGIFFASIFCIIATYLFFKQNYFLSYSFYLLSGILLLLAFTIPIILSPLNHGWMFFGFIIGKIVSPIVLGSIYFGLIFPIGFVRKLFGNDELKILKNSNKTYWVTRKQTDFDPKSFKNQF